MLIDYAAQKEEDFEKWWNDKGDETLRTMNRLWKIGN